MKKFIGTYYWNQNKEWASENAIVNPLWNVQKEIVESSYHSMKAKETACKAKYGSGISYTVYQIIKKTRLKKLSAILVQEIVPSNG